MLSMTAEYLFSGCKAILFDFGGTLDSDGEHWLDRFYEIYEGMGLSLPRSEIKRAFYWADQICHEDSGVKEMGLRPLMARHVGLQFKDLDLKDKRRQDKAADRFCTDSEGVLRRNISLLESLAGRYKLGVVSNFYGNVRVICEEAGLAHSLYLILDSDRVGVSKPHPAIFLSALQQLGLPPAEVVFVGDSYERDMIPARKLGLKTVWLKGTHPRVPPDADPVDARIGSLTELTGLLP